MPHTKKCPSVSATENQIASLHPEQMKAAKRIDGEEEELEHSISISERHITQAVTADVNKLNNINPSSK